MARRRPNRRAPLRGPMLVSAMTRVGRPPLVMTPQRHRKGGGVHRPRMPVRFKAGAHGRRKCRVGEGADCDSVDVRCDDELPVHGRTALGAKVIRDPVAVAGAKRGQLPAVAGEHPRLRSAFYGHLLPRNSRLHAEHAASPLLALVAVAQGYRFWSGPSNATPSCPQLHVAVRVAMSPPVSISSAVLVTRTSSRGARP
jgi:hypothetical protein